jgi:LuxR family maltose regulon positive regulatory protein
VIWDTEEHAGRPEAPVLLVTKLHPPFVPAQTVARERLFARLRGGRGMRLSLVACPAGSGSRRCSPPGASASRAAGPSPG